MDKSLGGGRSNYLDNRNEFPIAATFLVHIHKIYYMICGMDDRISASCEKAALQCFIDLERRDETCR